MLNEQRVILMSHLAMHEKREGKENKKKEEEDEHELGSFEIKEYQL